MVRCVPFRGLRPEPLMAAAVASPPYDVLDTEEARQMAGDNPHSFLRVNKPEIAFPPSVSQYDTRVYEQGARALQQFIDEGTLVRDELPSFYVYKQRMGSHEQFGIVVGASVEDYALGSIKRHEKTRPKKEDDRTRLTYVQNANVGPVFLMYRPEEEIDAIVARVTAQAPETEFVAQDGVEHAVWPVADPATVFALRDAFERVPASYVADGHHRAASAFRVGEMRMKEAVAAGEPITGAEPFNYFLAVMFPADQLKIMEYNRVVADLNGFTADQFLDQLAVKWEVTPLEDQGRPHPERKHDMGMYLSGQWFRVSPREGAFEADDPVRSLAVQVLHDNLLDPVLGIGDVRTDPRIDFVGGMRGPAALEQRVGSGDWAVAFLMFPVAQDDVMSIADAGALMPPKATWYEPKLASGLVVREC